MGLRLRNHLFTHRNNKKSNILIFLVKSYAGERSFNSQNYFSQFEISYESKGKNEISERTHRAEKNWNEVVSTINKKTHHFHMIKSNKELTLKTRETFSLTENLKK